MDRNSRSLRSALLSSWLDAALEMFCDAVQSCSRRRARRGFQSELLEVRTLLSSVTPDYFTLVEAGQSGALAVLHERDWDADAAPEWLATFGQQRVTQTAGSNQTLIADDFVAVDTSKTYGLSGWARSGDNFGMRFSAANQQSFGLEAYDADYLKIESRHVLKHAPAVDTTLQVALNPGDTQIRLNSVTGWSNLADAGTRALAWYGYRNSAGFTYPNYTYTRNVATGGANGLWNVGGINAATRTITLNAPWSGPALPVGTAVRNAITTTVDHSSIGLNRQSVPGDFTATEYPALIGGGTFANGSFQTARFAPGTAFVRPIIQANQHGLTNNFVTWQDVRIQELPATATLQDVRQPRIDMSVDLPGNQTVRLPLYSTGDTAFHIGTEARIQVSASQRYQLSVNSLDMTEEDLNPVGFYSYDADGKLIHSLQVTRHATAVDTRLARAVQPGDAAIYVNDATGWSNAIGSTAESRSLAWYGYQDSSGTFYADYTYTRNVAFDMMDGLWNVGGITFDSTVGAWKITLRSAWSGPSIASGTAVRNATGHDEIQLLEISTGRFLGHFETDPWSWTDYSAVIGGGLWQSGIPSERLLRPGTRFVQPALKSVTTRKFAVEFGPVSDRGLSEGASEATFADKTHSMLNRSRQVAQSDNLVPVSPTGSVTFSIDAAFGATMNAGQTSGEQHSIGYLPYDADGLPIQSLQVARYASAVDTTLAQALNPGDTQIVLSNAAGWSNVDVAGTRAIAWYGYRDSSGTQYPDYTYTRNVAADVVNGLWDLGAINGNVITLRQPWSGPALNAGTAVRNAVAGDDLIPAIRNSLSLPNSWTSYSATLSGTWLNGQRSLSSLPPGTAGVRLAVRANENNFAADEVIHIRNGKVIRSSGRTSTLQANNVAVATLDVLANDPVLSGNVSIIGLSAPRFGSVQVVAGAGSNGRNAVRYQSQSWHAGTDQFSYTVRNNSTGETWTTTTTITLAASNLANDSSRSASIASQAATPALNASVPTDSNRSSTFWSQLSLYDMEAGRTLKADDIPVQSLLKYTVDGDNDVMAVQLVSGATHGLLSLKANGTFEYTPESGFVGYGSFEYLVTDGVNHWTRRIRIHVRPSDESLLGYRMYNIALAFHNFHDVNQRFGISDGNANASQFDAAGNPKLSWRVYLLPYLGYSDLFAKFRLDEAWNSPNNFPLLPQMPDFYRSPGESPTSTTTRFQTISDLQDLTSKKYLVQKDYDHYTFARVSGFVDGTTNSILFLQAGTDRTVPWTQPIDVDHDPLNPYLPLGSLPKDRLNVATADASIRSFAKSAISTETLNALVTISGGETLDGQTLSREDVQSQAGPKPIRDSWYGARFGSALTTQQQLKQLGLAMHNYHDVYNQFPLAGNTSVPGYRPGFDSNGKQLLSWRVHLLPYLEQGNLYQQFHFDEPWNSPHNLTLLDQMPDIYRSFDSLASSSITRFKILKGEDALFKDTPFSYGPRFQDIVDGTSNTALIVEVGSDKAVPWTAPDEVIFDPQNMQAALGNLAGGTLLMVLADGSVLELGVDLLSKYLPALASRDKGEINDGYGLSRHEVARTGGESGTVTRLKNQLKSVGLGMHNYESTFIRLPVSTDWRYYGSDGKPYLSWRVFILPYIEQSALYSQFHFDEPWDSSHNIQLLDKMPQIYRSVGDPADSTTTRIQVFTGPEALFERAKTSDFGGPIFKGPRFSEIADGTSNTFLAIEAGSSKAVPWTKPDDLEFDPNDPLGTMGLSPDDVFTAVLADGSVLQISASEVQSVLKALITPAGGEYGGYPYGTPATKPEGAMRPGITVTGTTDARLVISEGELGAVHLVLDKPGNVQIDVALSVNDVVLADKMTLTFTTSNWNTPQAVTLKAIDDDIIDGAESVVMTLSVNDAATTTNEFDAMADIVIPVFNVNDDVPTIQLGASSVTLVEGGPAKFVAVSLSHRPASNVTLDLTSLNTQQATISPATLTFTPSNWNVPVNIQLTAVDDQLADGTVTVDGRLSASGSSDVAFRGMAVALLTMIVQDNEVPAMVVSHSSGETVVSEDGLQDTVLVRLGVQPSGDVRVNVFASDNSEVSVLTTTLLFNATNWNIDQAVPLSGVDDTLADGDITSNLRFEVAADSAGSYPLADSISVPVKTLDSEDAVLIIEQTGSDTVLSESGGTDQFTVRLSRAPLGTVTVRIVAGNSAEVLVGSSSLTFTSSNWNVPQSVELTGVDDALADGNVTSLVTISVESNAAFPFRLTASQQVAVRNIDNDAAQLVIAATNGNTSVNESGTFDDLLISLSTQPIGNVVVRLTSSDTSEAIVETSSLTFTAANWNVPQVVRVQGMDDAVADGTQAVTVTASVDSALSAGTYATAANATTNVNVIDNEIAALLIAETSGQTVVSESGSTDTFSVSLTSEPIGTVTVRLAMDDATEVSLSVTSLVFTSSNWNIAQVITVRGLDDLLVDGPIISRITSSFDVSSASPYSSAPSSFVTVTTSDNEVAAIVVAETQGSTSATEAGSTDAVLVSLAAQPVGTVVVEVVADNAADVSMNPSRLTFTESNWNLPQSVSITAIDDLIVDGTRSSLIRFRIVAAETTPSYRNAAEVSISVSTINNERPGIVVTPTNGSTIVAESGVQDTLNVSLNAQPLTDVWLTILPTLPADVITLTFYLKFTPENWQTPQSVILSSVNDAVVDGNVTSAIQIFVREDSDAAFLTAPLVSVPVTSIDNEVAALIVTETGGSTLVSETRTTDTFSVRLSDLPNGTVRVLVTSMDVTEGTVSPAELTFTPQNWNTPQQVTVTGVDDNMLDGHISFAIRLVTSSDSAGGFRAINGPNVTVVNRDDELPTVTIIEPATTTPLQQPVIRWTSSPEASSYQIWISKKTTPGTALINTIVTGNSFVPTSALGIGRFTSWVRIIHADGRRGQWSVARDFQINTPAVLDAMPRLVNTMRPEFRWQPLPGATQYEIWLANRTTGQSPVIRQSNLRSTSFTPTADLTLGTYAVWVRGIDSEGIPAAWSQGIEFRAAAAPVLTAPLTSTFENRPEFRWNPVTGATGYDLIFRNKVTLIESRILGIAGASWTSPNDLAKGPYEWWVRASGANGVTSLWSPTGSFEVGGRPTILSATGTNDRRLSLSWTSVVGAGSFTIQVDRIDVAQPRVIRTTITAPQTTFTSTPLVEGRYRIWIQAISTTGVLSAWSQSVDVQI